MLKRPHLKARATARPANMYGVEVVRVSAMLRGEPKAPCHKPMNAPLGPKAFVGSPVDPQIINPLMISAVKIARTGTAKELKTFRPNARRTEANASGAGWLPGIADC